MPSSLARRARRVHGDVAAADDRHHLALFDGRFRIGQVCLHEVRAGEKFVGGKDALQILARNAHKAGQTRAAAEEHRLVTVLFFEFLNGEHAADDHVGLDLDAERLQAVHFLLHDGFGQTEFGDAVDEHTARDVKGFIYGDVVAEFCEVARAGQARGTAADDGDFMPVGRHPLRLFLAVLVVIIGDEPFEPADADGLVSDAAGALALALRFLRTDPAAHGGKCRGLRDDLIRRFKIPFRHFGDEFGDMYVNGTARNAGFVLAMDAALGFVDGGFRRVTEGDFLKIPAAHVGRLAGHRIFIGTHVERHLYCTSFLNRLHAFSRARASNSV